MFLKSEHFLIHSEGLSYIFDYPSLLKVAEIFNNKSHFFISCKIMYINYRFRLFNFVVNRQIKRKPSQYPKKNVIFSLH